MESVVFSDELLNKNVIIDTDWPFSLGYKMVVLSNHPAATERVHVPTDVLHKAMAKHAACEGLHLWFDGPRRIAIVINVSPDGEAYPLLRIVELVVHEVSHLVDHIFDKIQAQVIDTEIRAYMTDWLVGKVLYEFVTPEMTRPWSPNE